MEKKAKKSASLSVGDAPQITPGSLESASLTTWTTILDDTENLSKERGMLADLFNAQIADPLKTLAIRCDELRKKVCTSCYEINFSTLILQLNYKRKEIKYILTLRKRRKITTHNAKLWNQNDPNLKERMIRINLEHSHHMIDTYTKQTMPK